MPAHSAGSFWEDISLTACCHMQRGIYGPVTWLPSGCGVTCGLWLLCRQPEGRGYMLTPRQATQWG